MENFDDFDTQIQSDEVTPEFISECIECTCYEHEDRKDYVVNSHGHIVYFNVPTQVRFYWNDGEDRESEHWIGGIGYEDNIICGCCGGLVDMAEVYEEYEEVYDDGVAIEVLPWIDISDEIVGFQSYFHCARCLSR